jgi:hypothetical protein
MFRLPIALAAIALSAGVLAAHPASATTLSGSPLPLLGSSSVSKMELAANRNVQRRRWVYNRNRHGARYAYRHGPYRYRYGGWYYARPWWGVGPGVGIAVEPGFVDPGYADVDPGYGDGAYGDEQAYGDEGDGHIQWCMNRYRSYDPRSDTFMGYDGMRHPCNSPY